MNLPEQYTIETATWRDLGPLRVIEKACFGEDAWPLIDLIGVLTFPGIVRLKATILGQMVGFISGDGSRESDIGWITTIGVLPEYRNLGIGKALLASCEQILANPSIQLTVRKSNDAAIQMYLNVGYRQIDIWERYYEGGEDGLVMQKKKTSKTA
jgi:N-alpha-acetyltransferase 10/11